MNKSTKKQNKEYILTDEKPNSLSESVTEYAKKEDDVAVIPEGYMPLKEGMNKVRNYVKSLYE